MYIYCNDFGLGCNNVRRIFWDKYYRNY